jgi:hypothetical protein
MKMLLVGHGKMGQLVGTLAPQCDCEVAGVIDPGSPFMARADAERWAGSTSRSISRRRTR